MDLIDLRGVIAAKNPGLLDHWPKAITENLLRFLKSILRIGEINRFMETHRDKRGMEFVEEALEHLEFSSMLTERDRAKIPAEGRLIIAANHPLGGLDGLALLKAVSTVRRDVKIVVNDVMMQLTNLREIFLPYDIFSPRSQGENIIQIKRALENEEAVIFFPSAEVSRLGINGVYDGKWRNGAVYFARKLEAPVLPVHVRAFNSPLFYIMSLLNKNASMFLLPREIFLKKNGSLRLRIGDPIPGHVFKRGEMSPDAASALLRLHVYAVGKKRKPVFKTEKNIVHPVDSKIIKKELSEALLLDSPAPGKKTFLVEYPQGKTVLREIARLREITFRRVGEGTGKNMDADIYDRYYQHLVLWDEENLEIMGSYRIAICRDVLATRPPDALYTSTLFNYHAPFRRLLDHSIELGRSFIQYRYWKSNALHYLWRGIGALLAQRPDIRRLFGAVSISDAYPEPAKQLIYTYYNKWFGTKNRLAAAKNPFLLTNEQEKEMTEILNGQTPDEDYAAMKRILKNYGYSVPVLFKQYSQLVNPGGMTFMDFCVDKSFKTVDGLIMLDMKELTGPKRKAYIEPFVNA